LYTTAVMRSLLSSLHCHCFCHASATTALYTLSLHDALPIFRNPTAPARRPGGPGTWGAPTITRPRRRAAALSPSTVRAMGGWRRSEEHTSELQSRENLVCRLLLEKKKIRRSISPDQKRQAST